MTTRANAAPDTAGFLLPPSGNAAWFLRLLDAIAGRTALLDDDFRIVAVNAEWLHAAHTLGAPGSTVGLNYLDIYEWRASEGSMGRSELAEELLGVFEGRTARFVTDFGVRDSVEWITIRVTPVDLDDRRFLLLSMTDTIGEKREADALTAALRHNRQLAMVAETTDTLVLVTDSNGRVEWANRALAEARSQSIEDLIGRPAVDVLAPDARSRAEIRGAMAGERLAGQHVLAVAGDPRWYQIDVQPVRKDGLLVNTIALCRDVTELIESRAATAEEQALLRTIIDSLPVAVWWKDPHLRLLDANRLLIEELPDDFRGSTMSDLCGAHAPFVEIESLEREVIESGEAVHGRELRIRAADGTERTLLLSATPLQSSAGVHGVVTTRADTTEVHTMQLALADATRLEAIGQLAAGVAHEINTPVQYVSDNTTFLQESFTELMEAFGQIVDVARTYEAEAIDELLEATDAPFLITEIPSALEQTKDGLGRVTEIVKAMKDFSHPGTELAETDLNKAMESTATVSRNEWKYVAELQLDLDQGLPPIRCNEGQIKQAVLNLIVNAAHAIADADDGVKGVIRLETVAAPEHAVIRVADTGCGMTPDIRQRIFEQFFTTKEVGRGTGQGLAMVHSTIVQGHGGSIDVETAPGEGTTFVVSLPYRRSDAAGEREAQ